MKRSEYKEIEKWIDDNTVDASSNINDCHLKIPGIIFKKELLDYLKGRIESNHCTCSRCTGLKDIEDYYKEDLDEEDSSTEVSE